VKAAFAGSETTGFTHNALFALNELDRAVANHVQWLRLLHRTIICSLEPSEDDLAEDAHRRCLFGRWYYGRPTQALSDGTDFQRLGELHVAMHRRAARLLDHYRRDRAADPEDYDAFSRDALMFMTELRDFQHKLIDRVCTLDQLTGAWNRYALGMRLLEEAARVQRTGQPCGLGLMDIDHFKRVNDSHGHPAGDVALQAIVQFLKGRLRSYDSIYRYGGEEFVLCLPNTQLQAAGALLNRIREEMQATAFELRPGLSVHLTASFGVTELDAAEPIETSIERVDHALLSAKAQGRNRVCIWEMGREPPPARPRRRRKYTGGR
jgi:diguanylate cyclase